MKPNLKLATPQTRRMTNVEVYRARPRIPDATDRLDVNVYAAVEELAPAGSGEAGGAELEPIAERVRASADAVSSALERLIARRLLRLVCSAPVRVQATR